MKQPLNPAIRVITLTGLQGPADPKTPRPRIQAIPSNRIAEALAPFAAVHCLGWSFEDVRKVAATSPSDEAVLHLLDDSSIASVLAKAWPPKAKDIVPAVIKSFSDHSKVVFEKAKCEDPLLQVMTQPAQASQKTVTDLASRVATTVPREQVLPMFKHYCSECHDREPYVFRFDKLEALRKYGSSSKGDTLLARLRAGDMPPANAKHTLPPVDRKLMSDLLANPDN